MAISEREFAQAEARMREKREAGYVVSAEYDRKRAKLLIHLNTGVDVSVPTDQVEGLANARPAELERIEISPSGLGLHWPTLDADVYVPGLLQGVFGSRAWMARELGARGGKATSDAKAHAARENGRKGGRPKAKVIKGPKMVDVTVKDRPTARKPQAIRITGGKARPVVRKKEKVG